MPERTSIRRSKLYEQVATEIEALIGRGEFKTGERLPSERELMRRFGVGRTAVREAIFALQRLGLVETGNGTRHRVMEPTTDAVIRSMAGAARHFLSRPGGVEHMQDARTFLEVGLARHAAANVKPGDIERLGAALEENRRAIDDLRAFERTDVAFHFELARLSGNPIFSAIHEAVVGWLHEQRTTSLLLPGQNRAAFEAHKAIFEAIAARDPERAERSMRAHLAQVAATYWAVRRRLADVLDADVAPTSA
jgi:GntR family transcriptional repressor for pyruvate dehydrogenase complex